MLKERIMEDMKQAMRARERERLGAIRVLRAAIQNEEISRQTELDDEGVVQVVSRMVREYKDSIEQFKQGDRTDLVEKSERELAVLQAYLPEQLSREEIEGLARKAIDEVGARGPADKGRVMGRLMLEVRGKADGSEVNAIVTELLEQQA